MGRKSLWHNLEKQEAGPALFALAKKYKDQFSTRKTRAIEMLSLYEGLALAGFTATAYDNASPLEFTQDDPKRDESARSELIWNVGASIMDSIDAKLFALDKIKTQFVVTDGGYDAKRAAIMSGRFVEGQMSEPQGIYPDLWALWRHAARLAETCTGAAAVFFWSDPDEGKIVAELDDTLNMFVETSGLPYDGITSLGRVVYWDPERLAERYPDHEDAIFAAVERPSADLELNSFESDRDDLPSDEIQRVPVVQGWKMKRGKTPGVFCETISGLTLCHEVYEETTPPCVFYIPMRQLAGFWGRSRLERIAAPVRRLNEIIASVDEAERLTPKGVVTFDPTVTNKKDLETIHNVVLVPHTGPMDRKPVYEPPPPFHPLTLELLKLHKDACFDLTGMSEAHVTASREKGLSSGVAIRLVQDQVYERFAPTEEEFSRCVGPASAQQIIRCAREVLAEKGKFTTTWKSAEKGGFLAEINADVFQTLGKYKYKAEPYSVSGNINTPADRVELAEKLMSSGVITGEAYSAILQHFDVPGAVEDSPDVEKEFVFRQIDQWLYADVDKIRYLGPQKWMDHAARILQVGGAQLQAMMDMATDIGDPDVIKRLGFFSRFIAECEKLLDEKALREQKLQQQAAQEQQAAMAQQQAMAQQPAAPMAA